MKSYPDFKINEGIFKINFFKEKLPNGLQVLYHQDRKNPLISTSVLYHVGSKNDYPGRTGFAHFFEHLMFESTKNIKKGEYFKYIASSGGENNAYTNQDFTFYYEILPSNYLPLGLWLESERMFYATVDKESIDIQREVIKEERKTRIDNQPNAKIFVEIIPSLLFKKHSYRYPIIGSNKDLNLASEDDYQRFYREYYVPSNATLIIVGDFEMNLAQELVKKYFSFEKFNNNFSKKEFPKEDPIKEEIIYTYINKNIKIPGVFLGYRLAKINHPDYHALKIIESIFSFGESSRMVKNIINNQQLSSHMSCYLEDMEDYCVLIIYGIANSGIKLDSLLDSIDREIEILKEKGISQYELDKQINSFETKIVYNNFFINDVANNLGYYNLYYKDANFLNKIIDIYKNVTLDDVQKVANKYLTKNNRVRLYNIPKY
ncbi:M16 family metallopeptidase [Blattabacterium cuenoti]|uniref:M16 family metallopeptidase n=1 Tax=Blattabacterium cuenoti TaxID=1653831 RepID=UPI00163BC521|nr:pitrilysin family protein [Blattabacterium cuenoti]